MKSLFSKQCGFAMPAIFIVVAVAFGGSLAIKTEDGTTVASKMGIDLGKTTEFASMEADESKQKK